MHRFSSSLFASLLITATIGLLVTAPAGSPSWTNVSAQNAPRPAAGDRLFLKIDGVEGEAAEADHAGDVVLQSFNWSQTRGTDSSSKVQMKEFRVTMWADKAMPILMRKTAARERIAKVTLAVRNQLGQDYVKWTLSDAFITAFSIEDTAGNPRPKVTLDFTSPKIDVEYRAQLNTGGLGPAVKAGWDAR